MSAVTTKTEDIVRILGITSDWRVQQIEPGEVVRLLRSPVYGDGKSITTYVKTNKESKVLHEGDDGTLLVVSGERLQKRRADKIEGPAYVIVYNEHTPSNPKVPTYRTLACLIISPLADVEALVADYREIFGLL